MRKEQGLPYVCGITLRGQVGELVVSSERKED